MSEPGPDDQWIRHEAMDRAGMLLKIFETMLGDHAGMKNGRLPQLYESAERSLSALYRETGRMAFNEKH